MYRVNTLSLLLLALLIPSSTANRRVMRLVAACFKDNEDKADIAACLGTLTNCFEEDQTKEDIKTCVKNKLNNGSGNNPGGNNAADGNNRWLQGPDDTAGNNNRRPGSFEGFNSTNSMSQDAQAMRKSRVIRGCLKPYKQCIRKEVRAFISTLPACLNTTAVALGTCYKDNAAVCNSTCSFDDIPKSNPFEDDRSVVEVAACAGFQNKIMNKACAIVDCCEPCVPAYTNLMNCIVQDVGNQSSCELECPTATERRRQLLLGDDTHDRLLQEEEEVFSVVDVSDECAAYLDTKEEKITANALNAKLLEGEFTACLQDVGLSIAASQGAESTGGTGDSSTGNHARAISGMFLMTVLGMFLVH